MKISNVNLAIGFPLTFPFVPSGFFYSFALMEKPDYMLLHADGGSGAIHTLRNDLVVRALHEGASHLLMLDTDQVYHRETVTRLLSHRLPVVAALVHRRYPPFDSIMLKARIGEYFNYYESMTGWEDGALVEVDATGAACILYETEIFRRLPAPWFKENKAPKGAPPIGEDIGFCQDLRAAGYRIFVDTSVPAGHLTTIEVNTAFSKLYRQTMEAQRTAIQQAVQSRELQTA